ncbi:MAG TPA: cobalamin-independent methionine synthase II family protein [Streptosporangiaceae bacterium]|jgi:5-methyltetrahydropteroyltriglutamate--homocysteine methyltransferase|nr:cobalamin-independent methionine synthase II family protein [Streptosporangiaceae bacterium]
MRLSNERILTTHTGSLPRPAGLPLVAAERSAEELTEAVDAVVQAQTDAGIDVVNDGEASKPSYATYVTERLNGFGGAGEALRPKDYDDFPQWAQRMLTDPARARRLANPVCVGPVSYGDTALVQADIQNLKWAAASRDVTEAFMTAASPGVIAIFQRNQFYGSDEEYIGALADAMKTEYDAIHQAGLVLQLDCPDLAMGWNVSGLGETQEGFLVEVGRRVAAINHATRDIPPERMRLHLCWGNYEGPHVSDIPLIKIIGEVLKARPAAISFEGANPRHEHEWVVFDEVRLPDDKAIIPGVIDSTTNYVEHPELVAQRIERYAHLVGRENVLAGSDCGFATFATSSAVDPQVTWAKLAAMAEGARLASQVLWA